MPARHPGYGDNKATAPARDETRAGRVHRVKGTQADRALDQDQTQVYGEGPVPAGAEGRGSGQAVQIQPESPDETQPGLDAGCRHS